MAAIQSGQGRGTGRGFYLAMSLLMAAPIGAGFSQTVPADLRRTLACQAAPRAASWFRRDCVQHAGEAVQMRGRPPARSGIDTGHARPITQKG
jgi:hypothetical protein